MTETNAELIKLAKTIDHTLLKPSATAADFQQLCVEAKTHEFFSVCVPPSYVSACKRALKNSPVKVCTVIGFPLGYNLTAAKVIEAKSTVENGADELDLVFNISAFKSGETSSVLTEIEDVVRIASGRPVKVIIETCFLTDPEKVAATQLVVQSGASFVKTSTGFGSGGATVADVKLLANVAQNAIKVKASGGIRNLSQAQEMLAAGASRLGTSNGVLILGELAQKLGIAFQTNTHAVAPSDSAAAGMKY